MNSTQKTLMIPLSRSFYKFVPWYTYFLFLQLETAAIYSSLTSSREYRPFKWRTWTTTEPRLQPVRVGTYNPYTAYNRVLCNGRGLHVTYSSRTSPLLIQTLNWTYVSFAEYYLYQIYSLSYTRVTSFVQLYHFILNHEVRLSTRWLRSALLNAPKRPKLTSMVFNLTSL